MVLYVTSGFRIEIMYVYYIAMESMFLVARIFFNLSIVYVQLVSHTIYHELNTNTTKTIQTKSSNPFTILIHQTLHPYNKIFLSNEGVSKGHKHSLIY
jgi:hypothetical protein